MKLLHQKKKEKKILFQRRLRDVLALLYVISSIKGKTSKIVIKSISENAIQF